MIFIETENKELPTIILLHGGGLSWWSLKPIIELLKKNFHVVTPIIDGHGEAGKETFVSIENSALKLIEYIDNQYNGKVFAVGGLSIGAQIVTEVLSLIYGLIKKRWFSKLQAKTLCVPEKMFEQYYDDSLKITKESLINITLSNGNYNLKNSISDTKARVLVIVGEKELSIMKKSGIRLHEVIAASELYIASNMGHGGISLLYPEKYVALITNFFHKKNR